MEKLANPLRGGIKVYKYMCKHNFYLVFYKFLIKKVVLFYCSTKMGRNKKIVCDKCLRVMRKDTLKRYLKQHEMSMHLV